MSRCGCQVVEGLGALEDIVYVLAGIFALEMAREHTLLGEEVGM